MEDREEKSGGEDMQETPQTSGRDHYDPRLTRRFLIAGMAGLGFVSIAVVIYFLATV